MIFYYLIDYTAIILDEWVSLDESKLIPLVNPENPRVNAINEKIALIKDLYKGILSVHTETNALRTFILKQVFVIKRKELYNT